MALTQSIAIPQRGPTRSTAYGYFVAPGEVIYTGSLFGVNASNQAVRIQTAGIVAFAGLAVNAVNNLGITTPSASVVKSSNDTWALTVPGATPANVNGKVYAIDDGTLTLTLPTTGFTGPVGHLESIDPVTGQTWVKLQGY